MGAEKGGCADSKPNTHPPAGAEGVEGMGEARRPGRSRPDCFGGTPEGEEPAEPGVAPSALQGPLRIKGGPGGWLGTRPDSPEGFVSAAPGGQRPRKLGMPGRRSPSVSLSEYGASEDPSRGTDPPTRAQESAQE